MRMLKLYRKLIRGLSLGVNNLSLRGNRIKANIRLLFVWRSRVWKRTGFTIRNFCFEVSLNLVTGNREILNFHDFRYFWKVTSSQNSFQDGPWCLQDGSWCRQDGPRISSRAEGSQSVSRLKYFREIYTPFFFD